MPEAAVTSTGLAAQLLTQMISRLFIFLLVGHLVEQQQRAAVLYIIYVIIVFFVSAYISLLIHKGIHAIGSR